MKEMAKRLAWFFIASTAFAYVVFLFAGTYVYARASESDAPTLVRDEIAANLHHLSGMVMVPATCTELSVRTERVTDTLYRLRMQTWESPSVDCVYEEVPRLFRTILHAPAAGLQIVATLDDAPYPILLLPVIQ